MLPGCDCQIKIGKREYNNPPKFLCWVLREIFIAGLATAIVFALLFSIFMMLFSVLIVVPIAAVTGGIKAKAN